MWFKRLENRLLSWDLKGRCVISVGYWEGTLWPWCWKREENTCSGTRVSFCIWPKIWASDCCLPSTPAVAYLIQGWARTHTSPPKFGHLPSFVSINTVSTVSEYIFNKWIVFIFTFLWTIIVPNAASIMFLLSASDQGELETWCLGARFKDGHGNGHLYGVRRDHHPGICCLKSLHWRSCVWGINFQSHMGCILICNNSNISIVKIICDDFPECRNLCFCSWQ